MQPLTFEPETQPRNPFRALLIAAAAVWLALCIGSTSVGVGFLIGRSTGTDSSGVFGPFFQAWDLIHTRYVNQPVDDAQLIQGAIRGMMESLGDPHSAYMPAETYAMATEVLGGYVGIGVSVDSTGPFLEIVEIFPGSPAEEAGLEPGDQIVKIDGEDLTGKGAEYAKAQLVGEAGTHVRLGVSREGESELLEFDLVRAEIDPPVVYSKMLDDGIAYVYLSLFSDGADAQMKKALADLLAQEPQGLVLDLRQNIGGYVDTAVAVGSQFLAADTLLFTEKTGGGSEEFFYSAPGGLAVEIPLVVLVDGGTASAAEIVAGAIQDHRRALLVGTTTYGKGSVQEWIPLMNDMGAVSITVALWYTPSGRQISKAGLTPDVEVGITEEQFQAGEDPQLARALEVLKSERS
ncbi:MAG: S41 family peptidase [Anaerolineales bacterium]|nr:S41 family peptidase [Anaerolineales bacterium]